MKQATSLNQYDIVDTLARQRYIENLVVKYTSLDYPYVRDLCQDLYMELLNKPEWLLNHLVEQDELEYYIRRMIINQLYSNTSSFYYTYQKYLDRSEEIMED